MMKVVRIVNIILHILIGVGALFGGFLAIINPEAPMGIDSASLPNMPFANFFIPGLILFVIIGLGNLEAAFINWKRRWLAAYATGFTGGALVIWITVQCYMLEQIVALHVIYLSLGIIQGLLALYQLFRKRQFPFGLLQNSQKTGK